MKVNHPYNPFRNLVQPALKSKLEEYSLLGYGTISEQELWDFLTKKKWRKTREEVKVHEIVQDILSVEIGEYMNFATVEAFKMADFSFKNDETRRALLK